MLRRAARVMLSLSLGLGAVTAVGGSGLAVPSKVVLIELASQAFRAPAARTSKTWEAELTIMSDGAWKTRGHHGQLAPAQLASLRTELRKTRFRLVSGNVATCDALPTRMWRVRSVRGRVAFAMPCGQPVDPTVTALQRTARALVADAPETPGLPERPPAPPEEPTTAPVPPAASSVLVHYGETNYRDFEGDRHNVTVRTDGTWTAGQTSGLLGAGELASLRNLVQKAQYKANPKRMECAARLDGEAMLDAPGVGRYSWAVPCGQPDPSLQAILSRLTQLARTR